MHTAVISNTDGRNVDQWARQLCKNGTRKTIEAYKSCHMLKVPARVLMTSSLFFLFFFFLFCFSFLLLALLPDLDKLYIWNMLNFAQQLFGSDT